MYSPRTRNVSSNIRNSQRWGLPLLTLSAYLRFWSVICYIVTFWLVFFEKEVSLVALLPHIQSVMSCLCYRTRNVTKMR
jgi:hypothetical protein